MSHVTFPALVGLAILISGCSSSPKMTLDKINPTRVFNADKRSLLEKVKLFTMKEDYSVQSLDSETGRVIAYKTHQGRAGEDPKTILMHLKVRSLTPVRTEVEAHFVYSNMQQSMTSGDEDVLAEQYGMLFDSLGSGSD